MTNELDESLSSLDSIIADGFRRIDDAIERVIDRHSPRSGRVATHAHRAAQRKRNYEMSVKVELAAMAGMKDWDGYREALVRDAKFMAESIPNIYDTEREISL